jgi:acetyl esterase/lipase
MAITALGVVTLLVLAACSSAGTTAADPSTTPATTPSAEASQAASAPAASTDIPTPTTSVALTQPTGCTAGGGPGGGAPGGGGPAGGGAPGGLPSGGEIPTPTHADVAYASVSDAQVLDLFIPEGEGPFPLIIRIHGGAFKVGDKAMDEADAQTLLDAGFALASLNYRLSCEALFPAAAQDVLAATRFLRANAATYDLDPERFASWGESAGANLAAMIGVAGGRGSFLDDPALGNAEVSSAVQAVVGWYGPYDFLSMDSQFAERTPAECSTVDQHDPATSPESLYVGAPIQEVPDLANAASPGSSWPYVVPGVSLPPFLLAHGTADCLIPSQQSEAFDDLLTSVGATSSVTLLEGASHGDARFNEELTGPALEFLSEALG